MPKYSSEKNYTNSNLSSGFVLFSNGGEKEIRTLVGVLALTRFPVLSRQKFKAKQMKKTIHRYIIRCIVYKKNVPVVSILSRQIGAGAPLKTSREPRASAAARCERFSGFRESAQPEAGAGSP